MPLVPKTCYKCGYEFIEGDTGVVIVIGTINEEHPKLTKNNYSQREVMICEDHL